GLALAWGDLSSQFAAFGGVYALTFVVILTNLFLAAAWERKKSSWVVSAAALAAMPYLLGGAHLAWNRPAGDQRILTAALVQTGFPIEETLSFSGSEDYYNYILDEWREIFRLLKPVASQKMNLVALPELTVPGGTYFLIYDFDEAADALKEIFGRDVEASFPSFDYPVAGVVAGKRKVNNAFFAYTLANYLNADLAIGLEAHEEGAAYTTLTLFQPGTPEVQRYEKQLLVPMGEYVPLGALRDFAASYGVVGSFEAGDCCKVLAGSGASYGPSVCYEEVVGSLMRHNRPLGADILVNITNDGWFPGYGLPRVHYEHARLRTVETGLPALRACNTGVTAALDSFGRPLAMLDESGSGVLTTQVPLQKAFTLYSHFGDGPIVLFSLFLVCLFPRKII
ncbi:MAG: apolipoprotein N-acyltransferase, partial [Chlamydiia bacterium]|nr:apolipoprotein N-acyltransferase [Chlamydiia bacterium]